MSEATPVVAAAPAPTIIDPSAAPLAKTQPRLDGKKPQLQHPVTSGFTMIPWFYMYQLADGTKHIMRLTGVENRELVLQHAEQMHPGETVELHPQKYDDEITEAWAKLAEDPAWYPVNEQTLKEIKNSDTMGVPHPSNEAAGSQVIIP